MNRNHLTVGLFLVAALCGGAYIGTGAAPVAFGASVAPQQAMAANWSMLGGIGAAIGGAINLFRSGGLGGLAKPIQSVTDALADGQITRDEISKIVKDAIGEVINIGGSGGLGGGVKTAIETAKKTEQVSAEAAIDLLAGFAAVRGDAEVSALLTEVGSRIKAGWYGGTDLLPDVSPAMILGLLRLNITNDKLNPILDVIRGRLTPTAEAK